MGYPEALRAARRAMLGGALLLALTPSAARGLILTPDQMTALMFENQAANAEMIGLLFGPDAAAPLDFTSNVSASSFSFALPPTLYLGQALVLTGSGVFDPVTDILSYSASGSYGACSLASVGTGNITLASGLLAGVLNLDFLVNGIKAADSHLEFFERTNNTIGNFSFATDENGEVIPGSIRTSNYRRGPDRQPLFTATAALGFTVSIEGVSPIEGGAGRFTTRIEPVPEPATLALFGAGTTLLGLLWAGQRPRRG